MQTAILASPARKQAWLRLVGENTNYTWVQDTQSANNFDFFIDLDFDFHPERIRDYAGNTKTVFLLSAVLTTPEQAFLGASLPHAGERIFGINAIPTFLERTVLEFTNPFGMDDSDLRKLTFWQTFEKTESRVGMVTPRIVFMIINEAYYTLQEGTANKPDIDQAMKLGTNYPKGPFEWCAEAGIDNVYCTLNALYSDTNEERYKICPLLKSEWVKSQI